MTHAEELVRSTTQAIASTVRDVPPLRLEQAPDEVGSGGHGRPRPRARHWRPWLAPAAAAVAIVVVALALVIVKNIPNGPTPPRPNQKNAAVAKGVPEYYVALMQSNRDWTQGDQPPLVIGDTATGAQLGKVLPPSGVYLNHVYGGADDDRTFVVTGERLPGHGTGTLWYLLRITPGAATPPRLAPLPIPVSQVPAGGAISPDGTRLAVAVSGTPAVLRIYSMATGALLRTWSAPGGQFAPVKEQSASFLQYTAMTLQWFPAGQALAFAWDATAIRGIEATAPDGDLLASSYAVAAIGTTVVNGTGENLPDGTAVTCNADHGWDVFVGAQGYAVDCAATWRTAATPPGSGSSPAGAGKCPSGQAVTFGTDTQQPHVANGRVTMQLAQQPLVTECSSQVQLDDGTYIAWGNTDNTVMIGSLVRDGHVKFGVLRGDRFTPLPALLISLPVLVEVVFGMVAW